MAPVTRSSRKCTVKEPPKARHILSDMTNMSKKPKVGESELQRSIEKNTKMCVYSSIVNDNLKPEEKSDVYDFQGNNSPPRKKNKRNIKPKRKRFSLSDTEDDEETPVQSMKLRNARKKHVPVKKRNNHKVSLEDQKIKISNTQEFKVTAVKNASKTVKFTPDTIPETEKAIVLNKVVKSTQHIMNTKESSSITEAKDSAAKITKKVVIDTPKNNKSMSQETELQDNQEYDEIGCFISLNNDKSAPLREIKDNDQIKNIITSKNDKTIPMGDKLNDYRRVNTQALAKGRLFASTPAESTKSFNFRNEIDQDNSYSCPQENKENSPDANFRHPSEMFILSPIERDSRTNFITKRKVKNKPRVEDFTIENCFGFDESEDEINISAHHTNVPFSLSSTPFVNKKPARPFKELPRLVLPAQATQFCTKLPILPQGSSKRVTFSLSNQNTLSQLSLGSSAISINSSKQSMLKKQNATQVNTIDKYLCAPSTSYHSAQSEQFSTSSIKPVPSIQPPVSSEEVTSTATNPVADMFEEKDLESSFAQRPRRSYARVARVRHHSQSEPESDNEDEICQPKRTKPHKKQKVQEVKLAKWAANVSAEFDQIDSFELCVE